MSIIRSAIFEIGDMVDSMNRGGDLYQHVHRLNELRRQLKWVMNNDFPLRPQNLGGAEVTVDKLLQTLPFITTEEGRKLLNRFIYGCIADALTRGPSQAGTESTADENESASTTQESVTRLSDEEFLDSVFLAVLPTFVANAMNHKKFVAKERRTELLFDSPSAAYQCADLALKARNDRKTDK